MTTPSQTQWMATAVHPDGRQVEACLVQPNMPLLEEFAAALLGRMEELEIRPIRGGRRVRSRLRALKNHGFDIHGIRSEAPMEQRCEMPLSETGHRPGQEACRTNHCEGAASSQQP